MTIFGKPLDKVQFEDVEAFCSNQVREGINLDYKLDLSSAKPIVKAVAAFANTRGGYLIIGVKDDGNDKPKLPVQGMDWSESLPLTITNMLIAHMYPYFSPEIHVCEPKGGKTFVVIHVPESHEAPHWLFNRSELYIRLADRSKSGDWERYATDDEWEFLRNKRERSVELREQALGIVHTLYAYVNLEDKKQKGKLGDRPRADSNGLLKIAIIPLFPRAALADVPILNGLSQSESIQTIFNGSFPYNSSSKIFQDGVYRYVGDTEGLLTDFFALTRLGVITNYQRPLREDQNNGQPYVYYTYLVEAVEALLRYAKAVYGGLAYHGSLLLCVSFKGPNFVAINLGNAFVQRRWLKNPLGEFDYTLELSANDLSDQNGRVKVISAIALEFLRSFGYGELTPVTVEEVPGLGE